jgi:hypothetical protein
MLCPKCKLEPIIGGECYQCGPVTKPRPTVHDCERELETAINAFHDVTHEALQDAYANLPVMVSTKEAFQEVLRAAEAVGYAKALRDAWRTERESRKAV